MSERTKKIIFAVFFIAFSAGMGYALYWMFFRAQPLTAPRLKPEELTGQLPSAGTGGPRPTQETAPGGLPETGAAPGIPTATSAGPPSRASVVREGISQAVTMGGDGRSIRYYNPDDGRFYRADPDGTIRPLGNRQFFNVDSVHWENAADKAIMEFPDGSNIFYDFTEKRQVTLPKHWEEFSFAGDDSLLASKSIGQDPDNRFIVISHPDGTEARAIEALGSNADKAHIHWNPTGQIVGYATTGDPQGSGQQILFFGQNKENFSAISAPGFGFLPNWSPSGKTLLFSVRDSTGNNKPLLWLASGDPATLGANRRSLNLNTWADKCAWGTDAELFCGVPKSLPDDAGLLRSQYSSLPDDIYRIDVAAGTAVKISTPEETFSLQSPRVNRDRTKLVFTDAATGKLYTYSLR